MLLSFDGLAAAPFAPFRVKLLLLHAREALHLSKGSPLSLVQTIAGEMDYQNWVPQLLLSPKYKQLTNQLQFDYDSSLTMNRRDSSLQVLGEHDSATVKVCSPSTVWVEHVPEKLRFSRWKKKERERVKQGLKIAQSASPPCLRLVYTARCLQPVHTKTPHALNTAVAVLPTAQILSQLTPTNWTRSAAHFWLHHLSGVTWWICIWRTLQMMDAQINTMYVP